MTPSPRHASSQRRPRWRRRALVAARAGFVASALGLTSAVVDTVSGDVLPAAAATSSTATIVEVDDLGSLGGPLTGGDSATEFGLLLPTGAACAGDSANDGYRVSGYMVASSVDPATLTFDANGPVGIQYGTPQATFRQPLFDENFTSYVAGQTANAPASGQPGPITSLPVFAFNSFEAPPSTFNMPAGTYNIGVGCFVPQVGGAPIEDLWNAVISVAADGAGDTGPADITWTVVAPPESTTVVLSADPSSSAAPGEDVELTATIQPVDAEGTITFRDGGVDLADPVALAAGEASTVVDDLAAGDHVLTATFTPADGADFAPSTSSDVPFAITQTGATTTTALGATTTTLAGSVTTTTAAVGGNGVSTGSPLGSLARTGGSISLLVWAGLMLVFGRMAILLGRKPTVRVPRI